MGKIIDEQLKIFFAMQKSRQKRSSVTDGTFTTTTPPTVTYDPEKNGSPDNENDAPLVDCQDCVEWPNCKIMGSYDSRKPISCWEFIPKAGKEPKTNKPDFPKEVPRGRLLDDED